MLVDIDKLEVLSARCRSPLRTVALSHRFITCIFTQTAVGSICQARLTCIASVRTHAWSTLFLPHSSSFDRFQHGCSSISRDDSIAEEDASAAAWTCVREIPAACCLRSVRCIWCFAIWGVLFRSCVCVCVVPPPSKCCFIQCVCFNTFVVRKTHDLFDESLKDAELLQGEVAQCAEVSAASLSQIRINQGRLGLNVARWTSTQKRERPVGAGQPTRGRRTLGRRVAVRMMSLTHAKSV